MREEKLYPIIADIFSKVAFSERKIELMYKAAKERTGHDTSYAESILVTLQSCLDALKTKESRLLDTFPCRVDYERNL